MVSGGAGIRPSAKKVREGFKITLKLKDNGRSIMRILGSLKKIRIFPQHFSIAQSIEQDLALSF